MRKLSPIHMEHIGHEVLDASPIARAGKRANALSPRVFERWHAATVIAAFWRGVADRERVWGPGGVNEHYQATNIARTFRGMLGRAIVRKRRFEWHTILATRMQSLVRGRL